MNTNSIPGNSKTPNEIQAFRLVWNDVTIFIKWEPEAFGGVIAHLEMMSEDRVAFPISETGYRSHFCHRSEVESCG